MTIQDLLDLANTGDPQAAELAARYPELPQLLAAGMPAEGGFHKVTWPGALHGPAFATYRLELFGRMVDPATKPPYSVTLAQGAQARVRIEVWLTKVFVESCASWAEIFTPPAASPTVTIFGVEKAKGAGELGRLYKAIGFAQHITRTGRPPGSGAYATDTEFRAALGAAFDKAAADGERITQPVLAEYLDIDIRQLQRLLHHHGTPWRDVKCGSF